MTPTTFGHLGELFDGPHATPARRDEGPYFLNISSLTAGRLDLSVSDHVSEEDFAKWTRRVTPEEGDLLFSYETRLGEAALMPAGVRGCLGRRMALLRPQRDVVDPRFLLYYYLSPQFQAVIQQRSIHGATVERILLSSMADWPVQIPPMYRQRAIAEVLGALDDKIAANSRLSSAADGLAAALVKRTLHSASMLGDVADLVMGTSPTGATMNEMGEGIPFFQGVRDFGIRLPKTRVFTVAPIRMAARGDVLISVRAPVGQVNRADRDLCIGRGLAAARSKTPATLLHALRQATVWESFNGEGTVFGSINRMDLHRVQIPWASDSEVVSLERSLMPLEARIDQAEAESSRLAELRDTLLPHLMSGRITVRDTEKAVEEVL